MRALLLSTLLVSALHPATALGGDSFVTGNRLFDDCNSQSEFCTGYIAGVVDSLLMIGIATNAPKICPGDRIELGQAVDVVTSYLRTHPERRQVSASSMATVALIRAFPCGR